MEERLALGSAWLWYYFTRVTELDQVDGSFLASRVALHENPLSRNEAVNESKTPTFLKTSKEEINSFKDVDALVHSGIPILASNLDVFQENFERALFDTEGLFPGVKVVVAWGDESMDDAVWTAKLVNDRVKSEQPEGKVRRNVALYRMEGANHVVSTSSFLLLFLSLYLSSFSCWNFRLGMLRRRYSRTGTTLKWS